jgi:hypothetical protein
MVVLPQLIALPPFEADSDISFSLMSSSSGSDWALATANKEQTMLTTANINKALNFIRVTFRSNHLTPAPEQECLSQCPKLT